MPGITDPTEAYFKDSSWGWDLTQWCKLALLWGYSDRWTEAIEGTASGAGNARARSTAVPAGYVYVLQALYARHDAGAAKILRVELCDGTDYFTLDYQATAGSGTHYTWTGEVVLKEDDRVDAVVLAPGDGKKVYLYVWGYKMAIAE